jgi:hypothetical protein
LRGHPRGILAWRLNQSVEVGDHLRRFAGPTDPLGWR